MGGMLSRKDRLGGLGMGRAHGFKVTIGFQEGTNPE